MKSEDSKSGIPEENVKDKTPETIQDDIIGIVDEQLEGVSGGSANKVNMSSAEKSANSCDSSRVTIRRPMANNLTTKLPI